MKRHGDQPSLFGQDAYGNAVPNEPPAQSHSPTSLEAAENIKPHLNELHRRVLAYLAECGSDGASDEQMQDEIPMTASTQRPRRGELQQAGMVRDSGKTRPTRSGRSAVVWVLVEVKKNSHLEN